MAKKKASVEYISRPMKIVGGMMVLAAIHLYYIPVMIMPAPMNLGPLPDAPESNNKLAKMTHLYRQLDGAVSLLIDGDMLYTGLVDGRVVMVDTSQGKFAQIETVTFTGDPQRALPFPCGKFETQHLCGRPLGVAKGPDGKLIVADAYMGLLSVDPETTKMKLLAKKPNDDKLAKFRFLNDVAVNKKGDVFFTESTSLRQLRMAMYDQFEGRAFGRLFKYDARKKKVKTVLKNMAYPTGIALSKNEDFLLVAERGKTRISKVTELDKSSPKVTTFAANLPIWPERITWDIDGEHLWVAGHPRHQGFSWMHWLADYPQLRSLLAKCVRVPTSLEWFLDQGALVLRLDSKGNIVNTFNDYSGRTGVVSGVYPSGEDLYFSMFTNDNVRYIGHMKRDKLLGPGA